MVGDSNNSLIHWYSSRTKHQPECCHSITRGWPCRSHYSSLWYPGIWGYYGETHQKTIPEPGAVSGWVQSQVESDNNQEEAIPIFKEAVVELDKNGLLPKRMNVVQAQRLVLGEAPTPGLYNLRKTLRHSNQFKQDASGNRLCLIAGHTTETISRGPLLMTMTDTTTHMFHNLDEWLMEHYQIINRILYNMVFSLFLSPCSFAWKSAIHFRTWIPFQSHRQLVLDILAHHILLDHKYLIMPLLRDGSIQTG